MKRRQLAGSMEQNHLIKQEQNKLGCSAGRENGRMKFNVFVKPCTESLLPHGLALHGKVTACWVVCLVWLVTMTWPQCAHAAKLTSEEVWLTVNAQYASLHSQSRRVGGMGQQSPVTPPTLSPRPVLTLHDGCLYVFVGEGGTGGFVVAAGSDRVQNPILGYSLTATLTPEVDALRWWLETMAEEVEMAECEPSCLENKNRAGYDGWRKDIEPLIATRWGQGAPYNNALAEYGPNVATGCVATAMAQLMNFYHYPQTVLTTIPDWVSQHGCHASPVAAGTPINWQVMPSAQEWSDSQSADAVAQLMRMCGQALKTDWSDASATGSFLMPIALRKYFGYHWGAHVVSRAHYPAPDDWNDLVYSELANGRPVVYSGTTPSGTTHTFLVDGYQSTGYFHINWGWNGVADGYFLLALVNPQRTLPNGVTTSEGFSEQQSVIVGVCPDPSGQSRDIHILHADRMEPYNLSALTLTRASAAHPFQAIMYEQVFNLSDFDPVLIDWNVGLFRDGQLLSLVFDERALGFFNVLLGGVQFVSNATGGAWTYSGYYQAARNDFLFGANLPDGHYKLCLVSRQTGEQEWFAAFNSNIVYTDVTISGNTATLTRGTYDGEEEYSRHTLSSVADLPFTPTSSVVVRDLAGRPVAAGEWPHLAATLQKGLYLVSWSAADGRAVSRKVTVK